MLTRLHADDSINSGTDAVPALANLLQITTSSARLFSLTVFNTSGADIYIQLHDSATTPTAAAVPKLQVRVLLNDDRSVDYYTGRIFRRGIFVGVSSSATGYTAVAGTSCIIDATFRKGL